MNNSHHVIDDDILGEILSFHSDDFKFIAMSCALVSKQWLKIVRERCKLSVICRNDRMVKGQFLQNIVTLKVENRDLSFKFDCKILELMKQLTVLDIHYNNLGSEDIKHISQLKKLRILDITANDFGNEGAKYISKMNQLTHLDMCGYLYPIDMGGAKYIGNMQQLRYLEISENEIGDEGAKSISQLNQLTTLLILSNNIGHIGAQYIGRMNQLTSLNISNNDIGVEGAKHIHSLKQLTYLY
ncbi:predicted protein [Naegleria gruberi]|uniref:Predicted protein n=1 Tax=Naegleria gruberi TaxID=5762 RepID=D2VZH6_NAEGR|nr:uncharacterized protein NAEGRDRAFT_74491 [Naegleria gruberi]EFC37848.1 predicted protein [Naegleria gruberi]|eukprot:XP_002670592.1 predicted protein [Naegleria gruberi strain NEG-M]